MTKLSHLRKIIISMKIASLTATLMILMKESCSPSYFIYSVTFPLMIRKCCGKLRERSLSEMNSKFQVDLKSLLFKKGGGFHLMNNGNICIFLTQ